MTEISDKPGTPAPAVLRAASILKMIARRGDDPPRTTDLANQLGLPKSSTTNIVTALVDSGLVRRNGNTYSLGPALVDLASAFLRHEDPVQRFREFVPTLPMLSQETAQLAMLNESDVVYLARHDGNQAITLTSIVGKRLPASSTALGKAILSGISDEELVEVLTEPLQQLTPRSHKLISTLRDDLEEARNRGYALDDEEATLNVVCLAVRVPGRIGQGACAVSTTLFKSRSTPKLEGLLVEDLTTLASYLSTT